MKAFYPRAYTYFILSFIAYLVCRKPFEQKFRRLNTTVSRVRSSVATGRVSGSVGVRVRLNVRQRWHRMLTARPDNNGVVRSTQQ